MSAESGEDLPVTDPSKLHPGGVLARMKELYIERATSYMRTVEGDMELEEDYAESVVCYLCGESRSEPFLKACGFRYVQCCECDLVYVNPRLGAELIEEFYKSEAYNYMFENMLIKSVDYRLEVIARKKFNAVSKYCPGQAPKLLDIGCGIGEFPYIATQEGWQVETIEFSARAAAYARERFGLRVHEKPLEECSFAEGQFEVATMWGVLEHLTDPRKVLGQVRRYLRDGGVLVIEVPSHDCLLVEYLKAHPEHADRIVDGWGHLMLFSLSTITRMITEAGFSIIDVQSLGLDIQTVLRYMKAADPQSGEHPVFNFISEHGQTLQDALESIHKADMIRVFARKD
jgi:2-polyprenyl-3-methyl-5-hydroxy-6-metoxy-1,4-benzoquinol methylase